MSTQSNAVPESSLDSQETTLAATAVTRPLYWSVRREIWENRSIYIAPLVVAAVVLFGFLISTIHLPARMRALPTLDPAHQRAQIAMPFNLAAFLILVTAFIVACSYVSKRDMANVAIAASFSGNRCRFPTSPPCSRRPASRLLFCRCSSLQLWSPHSSSCCC